MNWKIIKAFIRKEVYHILRDRRTLLILFGLPIAQVIIFGYAVTNEFRDAEIDVVDYSRDEASAQLIRHMQASGHFKVGRLIGSEKEIEDGFKSGATKLVLLIPADFGASLYGKKPATLQLIADGSDPNQSNTLVQFASSMLQDFQAERLRGGRSPNQIRIATRMLYNPSLDSAYNFIPGTIALILLLISALMTSLTIAREKELGTMEILLVSPVSPLVIILGKVMPYALLSFCNTLMILLLGYFVFEVPIAGSITLLLSMCLLYVFTALSLGILISTISQTQQDAILRSLLGLLMPSVMLSGFIFPLSSMPAVLQALGSIIPATYFIKILKGIMIMGVGFDFIMVPVLILVGMTLLLLTAAWKRFSIRLE